MQKNIILGVEEPAKKKPTVSFSDISVNTVYISNSSPKSLCLKISEDKGLLLQNDAGDKCCIIFKNPCPVTEILGFLTGIIVKKT